MRRKKKDSTNLDAMERREHWVPHDEDLDETEGVIKTIRGRGFLDDLTD